MQEREQSFLEDNNSGNDDEVEGPQEESEDESAQSVDNTQIRMREVST